MQLYALTSTSETLTVTDDESTEGSEILKGQFSQKC